MNEFETAKQEYYETEIPPELGARIQKGIFQGQSKRRLYKRSLKAAAACLAVFVAGLNLSPSFAAAAADVPVLGGLFQVLTVRSYQDSDSDRGVTVQQPYITNGGALAERINEEIKKRCDEKLAEGEALIQEYKEAFFQTGGTQQEWEEHGNQIKVTYQIKSQTENTVSFVVESAVSFASAYQEQAYYNLDFSLNKTLTLEDILGANWKTRANESIKRQIAASEDPSLYFKAEEGGFETVDETTQFYINEAGNPVAVFPRVSIAVGALGNVEFEIPKK